MTKLLPLSRDLIRSRAHELVVYLRFLQAALERGAYVTTKEKTHKILLNKELTHIMKANVCLLLYSAMEACMVQLLDEMHQAIGENCQGVDQLNEQLLVMVARHFKNSKTPLTKDHIQVPLHEFLFKIWLNDWQEQDQMEKRREGLSGNVDSRAIFKKLQRFGMFSEERDRPPSRLTHNALRSVKERRNQLAHGEISFKELGKDLAFEGLFQDSISVFRILRRVVGEVDDFLKCKRYLAVSILELSEV